MRPIAELSQRLRAEGLKVTSQRLLIYRHLWGNTSHPTAEQVYEDVRQTLPTLSLTTVYKALNELVDLGEIARIELGDGVARFDPNTNHHIHARCTHCGSVLDLDSAFAPVRLPLRAGDFLVHGYQLLLEGECAACLSVGAGNARQRPSDEAEAEAVTP